LPGQGITYGSGQVDPFRVNFSRLATAQQYALQQAVAIRQRRVLHNARTNAARLKAADEARQAGDIPLACRIYCRVATDRSQNAAVQTARRRLDDLKKEAAAQTAPAIDRLASFVVESSSEMMKEEDAKRLEDSVDEMRGLIEKYGDVPEVGRRLKSTLSIHLKRPEIRAVLCEPEAKEIWQAGQALEAQESVCCAQLLYEEAAKGLPAPSALKAQKRLAELRQDPQRVADAEACRALKWCHQKFRIAEMLTKAEPRRARELFKQIAAKAPDDSQIHVEAKNRLALLD
jgi:hypothetical protein